MCCSFISGYFRYYCPRPTRENVAIQETIDALIEEEEELNVAIQETIDALTEKEKKVKAKIRKLEAAKGKTEVSRRALDNLFYLTREQQRASPDYQRLVISKKTASVDRAGSAVLASDSGSEADSDQEEDLGIIKEWSKPSSPLKTKQPESASTPPLPKTRQAELTSSPPSKIEMIAGVITTLISKHAFTNGLLGATRSDWNDEKKLYILSLILKQIEVLGGINDHEMNEIRGLLPTRIDACFRDCWALAENLSKKNE
jgi:hypothetical protein